MSGSVSNHSIPPLLLARCAGLEVYFSTGPRISLDQRMAFSSHGKERIKVASKGKKKGGDFLAYLSLV